MKVQNIRPFALVVAATGERVEPGESVEVDSDLGKGLLAQPDNWGPVKAASRGKSKED